MAALTDRPALLAAAFALSGVSLGPFAGALFTACNAYAPPRLRGQVFTIGAGLKTTAAAGSASVGLIPHLSVPAQFLIVGAGPVLAGLLGAAVLPSPRPR